MEQAVKKNLIYFIWWNDANGMLRYNLELLERYIDVFDGQKIIKIADAKPQDIPTFLKGSTLVKNDPVYNEAVHFTNSLKQLKQDGSQTFYAHAKGVSRHPNQALKYWIKALYKHNLEEPPVLGDKMFSGCFGKLKQFSTQVPYPWHYSGSFYWFKNEILKRPIPPVKSRWFTECFPAMMGNVNEAEFRYYVSNYPYNIYSDNFWRRNKQLIDKL
jgi:hypothetical protein